MDFNYLDDSSSEWKTRGTTPLTVSARYRGSSGGVGGFLVVCFVGSAAAAPTILATSLVRLTPQTPGQPEAVASIDPPLEHAPLEALLCSASLGTKLASRFGIVLEQLTGIHCFQAKTTQPSFSRMQVLFIWFGNPGLIYLFPCCLCGGDKQITLPEQIALWARAALADATRVEASPGSDSPNLASILGFDCSETFVSVGSRSLGPWSNGEGSTIILDASKLNVRLVSRASSARLESDHVVIRVPYTKLALEDPSDCKEAPSAAAVAAFTRKEARAARSKAKRKAAHNPPSAAESAASAENEAPPEEGNTMGTVNVTESQDTLAGAVCCGFCSAAISGANSPPRLRCRPAPVGLLDDICWDLMCSACPVIKCTNAPTKKLVEPIVTPVSKVLTNVCTMCAMWPRSLICRPGVWCQV